MSRSSRRSPRSPGVAYQGFGEFYQRHWLRQWTDHLEREPVAQAPVVHERADLGGAR